jgi:hypothetical protein
MEYTLKAHESWIACCPVHDGMALAPIVADALAQERPDDIHPEGYGGCIVCAIVDMVLHSEEREANGHCSCWGD